MVAGISKLTFRGFAGALMAVASMALLLHAVGYDADAADKAKSKRKGTITKLTFDPAAERVELFAGMESGQFEVTVLPKDEHGGSILIENTTDKPLTVELPEAIVGVQVLKQFGGIGGMGGGTGMGGGGFGGGGGMGGGQAFGGGAGGGLGGGGFGGGGLGGGGFGGGGGNFFSVPPEKVVRVPYHSVCLEHGKAVPNPRMTYRLTKLEEFTDKPALQELVRLIARNQINPQVAQAAAWHLSDEMSWQELAAKRQPQIAGIGGQPYFTPAELHAAQSLVSTAVAKAKDSDEKTTPRATQPVRTRVSG